MTTQPQPNNATPQRLRLDPQTIPRMPFSSPMGEEVLSPTSPNASRSPPQHQIKLSQNKTGQPNEMGDKWTLPSQRPTGGERKRSQDTGDGKAKWSGLSVVTSLSKPPVLAQKAYEGPTSRNAGLGLKKPQGSSFATSRKASLETLGLGHQPSGKSLKSLGSKGRLGDLRRASSKWSNLSPSDRAVVIGISVSPEELAQQSASPEASPVKTDHLTEQHATARLSPNMPTIVVTPAKEHAPWSEEEEEPIQLQRRRIASSVYSQMTAPHNVGPPINSSTVPPIPPLPPEVQGYNLQNEDKRPTKKGPPPRIISTYTDIDETESPDIHDEVRPSTGESQLRILTKKASMDTLTTRPRSEGWWNHIISPFFPRSPMTFKSPTVSREPVTNQSSPAQNLKQDPSLQEARQTFPPPPDSDGGRSGHTSFTDSDLDIGLAKERLELDGLCDRNTLIMDEPQEDPVRESALLPSRFEGFGSASEYYEACLYDMHSATPYFQCQNHTCLPFGSRTAELPGVRKGNARGLGVLELPSPFVAHEVPRQIQQPQSLAAQQAPMNRFSAAFLEAMTPKARDRPASDITAIEDLDATPEVQEAHVAPVVRAPAPILAAQPSIPEEESEPESVSVPVRSPAPVSTPQPQQEQTRDLEERPHAPTTLPQETPTPKHYKKERSPKRYVAVLPPQPAYEQPLSPEPLSPGRHRQPPKGTIPLQEVERKYPDSHPAFDTPRSTYHQHQNEPDRTTIADLYPPPRSTTKVPRRLEIDEKNPLPPRPPKEHRPLTIPKCRNCFGTNEPQSKKKRWMFIAITSGLILMIILILVLVMTLTRKGDKTPIPSKWLNLTNFPPIPTGVSTIIQPDAVDADPDCVQPATMWSCALPKEQQQGLSPNAPDQPNFRVEIMFQNGTNATTNATVGNNSDLARRSYGRTANAVSAGDFVRDRLLRVRNVLSNNQYTPSPAPPSPEDQTFLGNTSDGNSAPFDGESTPFFMSLETATKLSSRLRKRQSSSADSDADSFHNITKAIPPPDSNPDGTAAAANLYPFPSAQPLRLYNRGSDTEHYGFYTYFDRSIFLKSAAPLTDTNDTTEVPDDENGGSTENAASVRCTWAQTRFLVQIWTKKSNSAALLTESSNNNSTSKSSSDNATTLTSSSANDFTQPGSFPYPVTITLDRHGGDIARKMVYCYGLDDRENINATQKQYQLEDRGVGGQLVNPALGPFGDVNVTVAEGGPGGIDGGSGGCLCRWRNFGTGV